MRYIDNIIILVFIFLLLSKIYLLKLVSLSFLCFN